MINTGFILVIPTFIFFSFAREKKVIRSGSNLNFSKNVLTHRYNQSAHLLHQINPLNISDTQRMSFRPKLN